MSDNNLKKGKIFIDNKEIDFIEGETILEAANKAEIYIPTLCYIKGLEPYGGCRLCIVQIEGMKGYPPACTTPAQEGMKIKNNDDEILDFRKEIFELLLSEHPYSCLICSNKENCEKIRDNVDKFGRIFGCFTCASKDSCELRKIAEYLGIEEIPYELEYHNYPLKRDDPFFEKDYNLCILCGKCVRICNDLRGVGAINFINRGHNTQISTEFDLLNVNTDCQFCGSCVDICPTGALSSKNTKWDIGNTEAKSSVCGFCSVGCGFDYYSRQGELFESIPNNENIINKGHGCVIGRFCPPQFNNGRDRLKYPSIKENGELIPSDWENIYSKIKENLEKYDPKEIAFLVSPNLSNESAYLLNKFANSVIKTENIAIISNNNSIDIYYNLLKNNLNKDYLCRSIQDIEKAELLILINTNIQKSHPVLFNHLFKARKNGSKIISLNLNNIKSSTITKRILDYEINFSKKELILFLLELSKRLSEGINEFKLANFDYKSFYNYIKDFKYNEKNHKENGLIDDFISTIKKSEQSKSIILVDLDRNLSDNYIEDLIGTLFNLLILLDNKIDLIPLWHYGNKEGVFQNISYNIKPKSIKDIINNIKNNQIKLLYLTERFENPEILNNIEFIILQDIYSSNNYDLADIILPTCTYLEDSGTFLNAELKSQNFLKIADSKGYSKPDWQIISELGKTFGNNYVRDFSFDNSKDIYKELMLENLYFNDDLNRETKKNLKFHFPDLQKIYFNEDLDSFGLRSFVYRGEPIYNQVDDLRELINFNESLKDDSADEIKKQEQIKTQFKVLSNKEIVPNTFELIVEAPLIAKKAKPGNFVIIMKNQESERLPMTLSDWNIDQGLIKIYYQEKGFSTRELTSLKKNDYIFSIVGPLGKEYPIKHYGTVLLGGGCYGNAAIYPIGKALKEAGNKIIIILEGKNKDLFYLINEIEEISDEIIYCTSDGSKGLKGKIDIGINYALNKEKKIDRCHFIGCNYMMMDASEKTKISGNIPTTVSLSTIMIDGTGMCGGCRLSLIENEKEITKFACVDGPIFDGHSINWSELIHRQYRFNFDETQIYQTHSCKLKAFIKEGEKNE